MKNRVPQVDTGNSSRLALKEREVNMRVAMMGKVTRYLTVAAAVGLFCVPLWALDPSSPDELLAFMQQKAAETETMSADATMTMTMPGATGESQLMKMKMKMFTKKPDLMHAETQMLMGEMVTEVLMVHDGTIMWTEQRMGGQVMVMKTDMAALKEKMGGAQESGSMGWDQFANAEEVKRRFEVKSLGKETIRDVETYGLELVPKDKSGQDLEGQIPQNIPAGTLSAIRLYLDAEAGFPVRTTYLKKDGSAWGTMDYTRYELNPELDDKLFTYTPPEGVQVIDMTEMMKAMQQPMPVEEE